MPDPTAVAHFESLVKLPRGADSLARYDRYYAGVYISGRKVIEGVYVEIERDFRSGPNPPRPRPSVHIVTPKRLPMIADGGCSVVTVFYDVKTDKAAGADCNGLA